MVKVSLEEFDKLLSKLERDMRQAFIAAVKRLGDRIDVGKIAALLRAGRISEAIGTVNASMVMNGFRPIAMQASYSTVFAAQTTAQQAQDLVQYDIVFDHADTETLSYLRTHEMNLIREMTAQALASVKDAIIRGQREGRNPRSTALDVRQFIGLTQRQSTAVMNYRLALEQMDRDAMRRELRDKRFDTTVLQSILDGKPMSPEKINRMVERYREKYLSYRATTIARTEALRAANGGTHLAWSQQVKNGRVPLGAIRRQWYHSHDLRVRNSHLRIPGMNKNGVGLNEPFKSPLGPILYPGDIEADAANTINCRCTVIFNVDMSQMKKVA
jgi:hypothetical protein